MPVGPAAADDMPITCGQPFDLVLPIGPYLCRPLVLSSMRNRPSRRRRSLDARRPQPHRTSSAVDALRRRVDGQRSQLVISMTSELHDPLRALFSPHFTTPLIDVQVWSALSRVSSAAMLPSAAAARKCRRSMARLVLARRWCSALLCGQRCSDFACTRSFTNFGKARVLSGGQHMEGDYPSDARLASKPGRRAGPVWHHSAVGAQRERKREAANKRKGCHRERESPSNRRSLPTCAGQPFRSAHLLHEQL